MSVVGLEKRIMQYLTATAKIKYVMEKHKHQVQIDGHDPLNDTFTIAPWDLYQIALNTGADGVKNVREIIEKHDDKFRIETVEGELEVARLTSDHTDQSTNEERSKQNSLDDSNSESKLKWYMYPISQLKVGDAFRWYLYHKIMILSDNGSDMVPVRGAINAVKSELLLPDDLFPRAMIEITDGSGTVDLQDYRRRLQPSGQDDAIYIFGKHDGGRFLEPSYFYFNQVLSGHPPDRPADLGRMIRDAFTKFQDSVEYDNYLLASILENVILTLEHSKTKRLEDPFFDEVRLKVLERNRVIRLEGGVGIVHDHLTAEKLKDMRKAAEKKAERIPDLWLEEDLV